MLNGNETGLGSTLARLCVGAATMCLSGFAAALTVGDRVEKPAIDEAPSSLIIIGRYVLTVDIFREIAQLTPGAGGELQLTDAIRAQAQRSPLHGVETMVNRWDTGTPAGFLTAAVETALLGDGVEGLDSDLRDIVERHRS